MHYNKITSSKAKKVVAILYLFNFEDAKLKNGEYEVTRGECLMSKVYIERSFRTLKINYLTFYRRRYISWWVFGADVFQS